jgi:predicted O-methyltransferase YrrM
MNKSLLPDDVAAYIERTFSEESQILKKIREVTATMPEAGMQISADQGKFLSILVKSIGAKHALEVGVFTGYSSSVVALALPPDGTVTACDVSEEFTAHARRFWAEGGLDKKITLHLGPAINTLDALLAEKRVFDFVFIDADKPNYCGYFERAVQLVRPNGLIAIDNTLWSGRVSDASDLSEGTVAIRQVNEMVSNDPRVDSCLVPIGDGITLARKR